MDLRFGISMLLATFSLACSASAQPASFYTEAAKPYAGVSIRVLDETTPLQETLTKIVPQFEKETGIHVEWQLLNHFEVIDKGQADLLSGRGHFDAVMLHGYQLGPLLSADVLLPIDDMLKNPKLANPDLDLADLIQTPYKTTAFANGHQYGFINWNYNQIYWARNDLLTNPEEQAAFKAKYGYDLGPAKTLEQMRDIAEFFTRNTGDKLAGKTLTNNFYGIVLEGIKGGTTFPTVWLSFMRNYGGDIIDADGKPTFDRPENIKGLKAWADLWKFSPPGTAEYSLIDVPTIMGNGIAAQALAYSDFVMGVDKEGASPLHGKFIYDVVPSAKDSKARSVESEPSVTVINRASKNAEATFLFLQWLTEKKQQGQLIEEGQGGVPIRQSSWESAAIKNSANPSLYAAMRQTLDLSVAKPKMPKIYEILDALSGVAQEVGLGNLTPEEGAKKGQEEMLKICTQCNL